MFVGLAVASAVSVMHGEVSILSWQPLVWGGAIYIWTAYLGPVTSQFKVTRSTTTESQFLSIR